MSVKSFTEHFSAVELFHLDGMHQPVISIPGENRRKVPSETFLNLVEDRSAGKTLHTPIFVHSIQARSTTTTKDME
jgi:hypothetical protein